MFERVGIVGVGLLGTSLGLALKARQLARQVWAWDANPRHLELAQQCDAIDYILPEPPLTKTPLALGLLSPPVQVPDLREDAALSTWGHLDALFLCVPVDVVLPLLIRCVSCLAPPVVVTDVGSTKSEIVRDLTETLGPAFPFVGSHPLAGSERQGPDAAKASLFAGRVCIVTPIATTSVAVLERVSDFWKALGMRLYLKTPEEHDRILSRTSHLPHLLASVLCAQLLDKDLPFTATGFRDLTRIAAGSPTLWRAIAAQNRFALLDALDDLTQQLQQLRDYLSTSQFDALERLLLEGKRKRDALGSESANQTGPAGPALAEHPGDT